MSLRKSALSLSLIVLTAFFGLSPSAHAVPIAIVDSGTDMNHPDLVNTQWTNLKDEDDAVDNDDNGYIDDVHGWNFAEQSDQLFDKRLLGKFSKDVYTFFEIQTKMLNGTATQDEIAWMKAKIADAAFIDQLQTFGNFVHGSHVAGIAAKDSPQAQIMGLKLIPTKRPKPFQSIESNGMVSKATTTRGDENKKKLILMAIDFLGKQQAQIFTPISAYMKAQGARVANCSFGTGFAQARALLKPLLEKIFKRTLPESELNEYASYFIKSVMASSTESFIRGAPNTLFVMAAGNDGSDNDQFPASPANIREVNTITVAATNGLSKIASFSNYGAKMVDVAAPGVGIYSSIPGSEHVYLSGTSQAAPFVANAAGQVMDANPNLKLSEVREILIATVDFKDFLRGKVASSGIVNADRAKNAGLYSKTMSVRDAIARSIAEVADQPEKHFLATSSEPAFVLPLPSLPY